MPVSALSAEVQTERGCVTAGVGWGRVGSVGGHPWVGVLGGNEVGCRDVRAIQTHACARLDAFDCVCILPSIVALHYREQWHDEGRAACITNWADDGPNCHNSLAAAVKERHALKRCWPLDTAHQ
jgi:hypothetical protein